MKIKQTENELIILETPGCLWIFGLFFISVSGVFVYGALGGFKDYDRVPLWGIAACFLMGVIGISVGVWQIYLAPVTKIIINRRDKTVTHLRRGLFGAEKTIYGFDQVKQFRNIEDKDSEGDPIWYLGMEFYSGKIIEISSMPSHSEKYKQDFVFEINRFLKKQMPSYKTGFDDEDETRGKRN